jgi:hypothetical protein
VADIARALAGFVRAHALLAGWVVALVLIVIGLVTGW